MRKSMALPSSGGIPTSVRLASPQEDADATDQYKQMPRGGLAGVPPRPSSASLGGRQTVSPAAKGGKKMEPWEERLAAMHFAAVN